MYHALTEILFLVPIIDWGHHDDHGSLNVILISAVVKGEVKSLPSHVSGFRKGHSTTTALISIRDDIIKAMHRAEVMIMVFADFSKAFDTVHFDILLSLLSPYYTIIILYHTHTVEALQELILFFT